MPGSVPWEKKSPKTCLRTFTQHSPLLWRRCWYPTSQQSSYQIRMNVTVFPFIHDYIHLCESARICKQESNMLETFHTGVAEIMLGGGGDIHLCIFCPWKASRYSRHVPKNNVKISWGLEGSDVEACRHRCSWTREVSARETHDSAGDLRVSWLLKAVICQSHKATLQTLWVCSRCLLGTLSLCQQMNFFI